MIAARLKLLCFAFHLFTLLVPDDLLDRPDLVWPLLAEPFEVELLDELGKRRFPRLLMMVRLLTEFLRIHPQFPCHLNLGMGEVKPFAGINPDLIFR